jgi:hypothetical protein
LLAPATRAPTRKMVDAADPRVMRAVAMADAMVSRGPADPLPAEPFIVPMRQRLTTMRPPQPLRFTRLMFHPLDRLIVPAARWLPGQPAIPRQALMPMARHVRLAMGAEATAIDAGIVGRTTADTELIGRLGRSLWPAAAQALAATAMPKTWKAAKLGEAAYRPLATIVATLLTEAAALDTLCLETATGLLPPTAETVAALLGRVAKMNPDALPLMITLLLDRLPETAGLLPQAREGHAAAAIQAAMDKAADLLLGQLGQLAGGIEARIATGTLAEAGATVSRIATLLTHLETPNAEPHRRDRLRAVRRRLNASCKARFVSALQADLLAPLQHTGPPLTPTDITALEAAARGLRILEAGARLAGSGSIYDLLLGKAADAIKGNAMRDLLTLTDQVRLVEILSGSDAALALLDQAS